MTESQFSGFLGTVVVATLFVGMTWDGPLTDAEKIAAIAAAGLVVVLTIIRYRMRKR